MINPSQRLAVIEPYRSPAGATMTAEEKQGYLKLDFNEATYLPSPLVAERLANVPLNFYPDMCARELCGALARYTGGGVDEIRVWNGSDAALRAICWAYLDDGDKALIREPTYSQFGVFVRQTGAEIAAVVGRSAFDPIFYMYSRGLQHRPKLVYIVNPNNPTGVRYWPSLLERAIRMHPYTLFVIDEAYHEYCPALTVAPYLDGYDNLIVVRTLSKAFALAGARVGYTLSSLGIAETLDRVRNGKDVSVLAQAAAVAALEDVGYMRKRIGETLAAKAWTVDALRETGIDVHDTPANFILIKTQDAARAVQDFRERAVLVRDRSYLPQMAGYIRVTVGTMEEMRRFVAIAKVVLL